MSVIDNPQAIELYRMRVLSTGLKLETVGMKRRGRSYFAIIKDEFGLKGTRERVLTAFNALVQTRINEYEALHAAPADESDDVVGSGLEGRLPS